MTTVAAEGRIEIPGAIPELGGRKPQVAGNGVVNVTGIQDNSAPKTDELVLGAQYQLSWICNQYYVP